MSDPGLKVNLILQRNHQTASPSAGQLDDWQDEATGLTANLRQRSAQAYNYTDWAAGTLEKQTYVLVFDPASSAPNTSIDDRKYRFKVVGETYGNQILEVLNRSNYEFTVQFEVQVLT